MQSPSTTAKFLKVTYVLFIKGGFLEGKRLQCHVIPYSERGCASKMHFLMVCSGGKAGCLWGSILIETCCAPGKVCRMTVEYNFEGRVRTCHMLKGVSSCFRFASLSEKKKAGKEKWPSVYKFLYSFTFTIFFYKMGVWVYKLMLGLVFNWSRVAQWIDKWIGAQRTQILFTTWPLS